MILSVDRKSTSANHRNILFAADRPLFFENKDRFYYPDYQKQHELIENNRYSDAIDSLLSGFPVESIFYGIGFPADKYVGKAIENQGLVDFIIGVDVK